jgi:alkanesulfonate monooxygenase
MMNSILLQPSASPLPMSLRFHWSLSSAGENLRGAKARAAQSGIPSLPAHAEFCRGAEESGIESLLVAFGFHRADPFALASALGVLTEKIKFLVASRSGIVSPTYFVQQVNTVSVLTQGRIAINIVAGHSPHEHAAYGDFLSHDERYERTDEFWTVCRELWKGGETSFQGKHYKIEKARLNTPFLAPDRSAPEIYVGGNSDQAEALAVKHASCLFRLPDTPERMRLVVRALRDRGVEVGLLVSVIARPTHDVAVRAAYGMIGALGEESLEAHRQFAQRSDSVAFRSTYELNAGGSSDWLGDRLWTGAVPYLGAPSIALVGSAEEIAEAILEYREIGISQFLFMGWPDLDAMKFFGQRILPLVRRREQDEGAPAEARAAH